MGIAVTYIYIIVIMKKLNATGISFSAEVLRAIAHPLRMQLLSFIDEQEKTNVKRIYKSLDLEQSSASQHLGILREAGLVRTEREGKFIFYTLNYEKIDQINEAVKHYLSTEPGNTGDGKKKVAKKQPIIKKQVKSPRRKRSTR